MTKATLSPQQRHVLDRMDEGWELGCSLGWGVRYWLQKESETVRGSTVHALLRKGLIKQAGRRDGMTVYVRQPQEGEKVQVSEEGMVIGAFPFSNYSIQEASRQEEEK